MKVRMNESEFHHYINNIINEEVNEFHPGLASALAGYGTYKVGNWALNKLSGKNAAGNSNREVQQLARKLQQLGVSQQLQQKIMAKAMGFAQQEQQQQAQQQPQNGQQQGNKLSADQLAQEIINGKYGIGTARKQALAQAGYTPQEIQAAQQIVNQKLGSGKKQQKAQAPAGNQQQAQQAPAGNQQQAQQAAAGTMTNNEVADSVRRFKKMIQ